ENFRLEIGERGPTRRAKTKGRFIKVLGQSDVSTGESSVGRFPRVKGNLTQAQNHPRRDTPVPARSAFGAGERHPRDFSDQKLWGTIPRRERWGLSWRGRCLVGVVVL